MSETIQKAIHWLGTADSMAEYMMLLSSVGTTLEQRMCNGRDEDEYRNPVDLTVHGSVGLITTSGSILSERSWLAEIYGLATYVDIQERFQEAAEDSNIKGVMHVVNTNGGAAEGCYGTSNFIRDFNNSIKPVVSFVGQKALSAGYWLASAGQQIIADPEAFLGSIGAISVHYEYTKMLEAQGINAKIYRSAPYKALGHPAEKRSELADKEMQRMNMLWHNRFVDGISALRGISTKDLNDQIANGRVYEAKEAVGFKMVDHVFNFNQTLARLSTAFDKQAKRTGT